MRFFDRRRLINGLLIGSIALNASMLAYLSRSGGLRRFFVRLDLAESSKARLDFQKDLEARYGKLPSGPREVIFAGDSLVGDGPWSELFGEVHNRGIGGDTSANLLGRLGEILGGRPRKLFLLVGTNDLAQSIPSAQYLRNYRAILERVRRESPTTEVVSLGIPPINPTFPARPTFDNAEVAEANRGLKDLIKEFPSVRFVDLMPTLADASGNLRREFSTDGMHLNLDGYLAIREALKTLVLEESTRP